LDNETKKQTNKRVCRGSEEGKLRFLSPIPWEIQRRPTTSFSPLS